MQVLELRFTSVNGDAPATFGAPCNTISVNHGIFCKSASEKSKVWSMKKELGKSKHHRFKTIARATL